MVLRVAAAGAAGVLFVTGMVLHDLESVAIALLLVGGSLLLRVRSGPIGRLVLAALFFDVGLWMVPAAWSNALHGGALSTLAVPLVLVALCVAGLAAAAGLPDRPTVLGAVALLVVALGVAALPATGDKQDVPALSEPGTVAINAKGAKFSTPKLATSGDRVAVVFHNKDLFWHTFTIDKLKVSVRAPLGATRVARFTAQPGTYDFYCAVPGHKTAGMSGTLTVT